MLPSHSTIRPHRRRNVLTGEWVLVSPHRTMRPWLGEQTAPSIRKLKPYEPECYLCPGNERANGARNPRYRGPFAFTNDYSALLPQANSSPRHAQGLLQAMPERGMCRVVNYSPRHDLALSDLSRTQIEEVLTVLQDEMRMLSAQPGIRHVQIFENRGLMMGNSNPHPHCQIWAQEHVPGEPWKEGKSLLSYYRKFKRSLLSDYVKQEIELKERMVYQNASFAALVPFWAVWPFETMIVPKRKVGNILRLTGVEKRDLADALKVITGTYDRVFQTPFPYSSGIHQAPVDGREHPEWHMHLHFYPPLLRSASVKKFMVGYEMLAEPQRDVTAEKSALILKKLLRIHPKKSI